MNTEIHRHDGMEWRHREQWEIAAFPREPDPDLVFVANRIPGEDGWAMAGITHERYAEIFKDKT